MSSPENTAAVSSGSRQAYDLPPQQTASGYGPYGMYAPTYAPSYIPYGPGIAWPNTAIAPEDGIQIEPALLVKALRQHAASIAKASSVCLLAGTVLAFTVFKDTYRSEATMVMNGQELPTVVSDVSTKGNLFNGIITDSNPFKNQEELFKSRYLAERVVQKLQRYSPSIRFTEQDAQARQTLSIARGRGSDFIRIGIAWHDPHQAQTIAQAFVESYSELALDLARKPLLDQKAVFQKQQEEAETALQSLIEQLDTFQTTHEIVDLDKKSEILATQSLQLEKDSRDVSAEIAQKQGEMERLKSQLKVDSETGLRMVAGGQNALLSDLYKKLYDAEQDYQSKALVYAPTNPDLIDLKKRVAILREQIQSQYRISTGYTLQGNTHDTVKDTVIKDQVRADLVKLLATTEADYTALVKKQVTLEEQQAQMSTSLQSIPAQQLEYAKLVLDKKSREEVLTKLREKLAEIDIQLAGIQQKMSVVDPPSLPRKADFPNRLHIILIAGLLGALIAATAAITQALKASNSALRTLLEHSFQSQVLGSVPWVPEGLWSQLLNRSLNTSDALSSSQLRAYQEVTTNLRLQAKRQQIKTIGITSVFRASEQPIIHVNIGLTLAKSGDSVVLIDTNLRRPRLHKVFGHPLEPETGLPSLLKKLSEQADAGTLSTPHLEWIMPHLTPSGAHPNLYYLNAGELADDPYDILNSRQMETLLQGLKEQFDWVLCDLSPALDGPDTALLLQQLDASLLIIEHEATEPSVREACKKITSVNPRFLGAVLRQARV